MDKSWTVSRGPVAANELDIRKAAAINALLTQPIGILPTAVGDPILPFALGLWNEIRPLLKPDSGVTALRRATGAFLHSKRYYFACAQPDSIRHDIEGKPIEALSEDDRAAARQRFASLKQRDPAAAPAAKAPPPPPAPSKAEQIRAGLLRRKSASTSPSP